ncbi:MAG: MFS transporter [Geodermatophilaceae bacterium]|nr:MFS transporter [Geodermatophilaceae bacterium]
MTGSQQEQARHVQRRTLWVLSGSQILGGVGLAIGIAVGSLLAEEIAGTPAVAGLASTSSVVGAALIAVPVSRVMSRSGRRAGLVLGYVAAVVGALVVVAASVAGSLILMLAGMFLLGAGTTAGFQARFAATDLAEPQSRGQALSLVVWATTIGAVLGPNLSEPAGSMAASLGLARLSGPFLISAVIFTLAALLVATLLRPDPLLLARDLATEPSDPVQANLSVRRSLAAIVSTVDGRLGLLAVVASHSVMVAVMVLSPIHLGHGGATLTVIGVVISVHIAGMYALSPVVGWLADRLGRRRTILIGAVVLAVALVVSGTAPSHSAGQVGVGLFLLGLGWSFGLISGSTLVTESVPAGVRPQAQGASDLTMGLCAGVAGALAGPVLDLGGYSGLNLVAGVIVVPLFVMALRAGFSPGRGTA